MDESTDNRDSKSYLKMRSTTTKSENLNYKSLDVIGSGSFGVVYQARCIENNEIVAIKKVLQDRKYKNRELLILKELDHINCIKMKNYFYTISKNDETYLNVVMDFIPLTLSKYIRSFKNSEMPMIYVKLYSFQMLRSINYIHSIGICHRDIKPQNILLDSDTKILKLCDFGSAKKLSKDETNVAYICSRYYRAPELIFGSTNYTNSIDVWSIGCVIAELFLSEPIFPGETSIEQIVEIIKVLGTPSRNEIKEMNNNIENYSFPIIKSYTFEQIYLNKTSNKDFFDLLRKLLVYSPNKRLSALEALNHSFFDELKHKELKLPDGTDIPKEIYEFSDDEIKADINGLIDNIVPSWYKNVLFQEKL